MGITLVLSSFYVWWKKVEHAPFGPREVRWLLALRGFGGFFGVFGMYYSLLYLPLSDATVITFLAPSLACFACSILIKEPFTRMEQVAAFISLFGVVLIARPTSLFSPSSPTSSTPPPSNGTTSAPDATDAGDYSSVTPEQRALAVAVALLGVLGAATAYTTLRWIGKRAHALISVNYFAVWCTFVSVLAMTFIPGIPFLLPSSLRDWALLGFLGLCGFVMQFLLAAGLQQEKSSRATNMVYCQMLFALAGDKLVFGTSPDAWGWAGSSLILGSAIYVAVRKEQSKGVGRKEEVRDEERGLVDAIDEEEEDVVEEERLMSLSLHVAKMLSRPTLRVASQVQKRAFSATRARLSSPYHYPEGPRSNIPFNPLTKFFAVRYWSFMAVGFFAPVGIAVWQTKKDQ
ncbi:putative membrane protein [Lasiodiplodia hormozganensis]|uniref:Cytochrome c oxidase subunit 8, mitochondrial n=2 Tax=Lasiodiplodia TaxID=66739 RepID=A0AA39YLE2_9PEZI|nr:putative membrane protein [Lasiodiplodia hormozganensis]